MADVLGQAILDYYNQSFVGKLWIHNKYGKKEQMYVSTYFRNAVEMPDLELIALRNCVGSVLDIGAGAGSHALELQEKGFDVTALEISEKSAEVMKLRGVEKIIQEDIFTYGTCCFDTLLLLMNGIGLTGNIIRLRAFLQQAEKLLSPSGQLLFDSSDVAYLYEEDPQQLTHYYGEIEYCYEYKKQKSSWLTWLYVDQKTMMMVANEEGWESEILFVDEFDQYLARLIPKAQSRF